MQEEKNTACVLEEIKNAALSGGLKVIKANENNFKEISFSKYRKSKKGSGFINNKR